MHYKQSSKDNNVSMFRPTMWDRRFIDLTNLIATWSSCLRRNVGAVIVKNKRVIATGYNGAPQQIDSCVKLGTCVRQNVESGTKQELCRAVHAEQNAIAQAARLGISIEGATLYCTHKPCVTCTKIIVNSGIKRVVYVNDYPDELADKMLEESPLEVCYYDTFYNDKLNDAQDVDDLQLCLNDTEPDYFDGGNS